ncbi:helix-turn-helix transcriptional regulator [uncultured Porticoccus sp.]|jgi:transcriptional regulator with XRE-family HTH domain|uniref:helix-turn-helix domain-containing protein n=1 Tax=uncultured Porticoccus sp. TaxID=1256050 RepID=UPI0030DAC00D|tara:strand:+ start:11443 stop:11871 length:429 start_codon:yes stop_codon:yes gene_type:complete
MLTEELEMVDMSFGENLRRLRRDKGLTQAELGKLADMKITHMSKLENDTGDPKLSTLYKLMSALECSADTLLMDADKVGVDGVLQASFDRAQQLPKRKKAIVIELIDSFCIADGMSEMFNSKGWTYRDGPTKPITEGLEAED